MRKFSNLHRSKRRKGNKYFPFSVKIRNRYNVQLITLSVTDLNRIWSSLTNFTTYLFNKKLLYISSRIAYFLLQFSLNTVQKRMISSPTSFFKLHWSFLSQLQFFYFVLVSLLCFLSTLYGVDVRTEVGLLNFLFLGISGFWV